MTIESASPSHTALADKLVREVNLVSRFFESQPGDRAASGTADHLRQFWAPSLRAALTEAAEEHPERLRPGALRAVQSLRITPPKRH